jgi:hypothetical protein
MEDYSIFCPVWELAGIMIIILNLQVYVYFRLHNLYPYATIQWKYLIFFTGNSFGTDSFFVTDIKKSNIPLSDAYILSHGVANTGTKLCYICGT